MTSKSFYSIIRDMKTYLRRWYILNQLYHFRQTKDGINSVKFVQFYLWLGGLKEQDKVFDEQGNFKKISKPFTLRFPLNLLSNVRSYEKLLKEIEVVINECVDKKWIKKSMIDGSDAINLDTLGMENYAFSVLLGKFFGNAWVKTIGISVILTFTGYYITNYILKPVVSDSPNQINKLQNHGRHHNR